MELADAPAFWISVRSGAGVGLGPKVGGVHPRFCCLVKSDARVAAGVCIKALAAADLTLTSADVSSTVVTRPEELADVPARLPDGVASRAPRLSFAIALSS